ncbi:NADP-dependent oxidoreductase domain-containing protein [Mariannaea sp. PMI_226]|nr:NADP-dependent oxidoreductase domain-containing protein [Mariannaea sp. PMI_226]
MSSSQPTLNLNDRLLLPHSDTTIPRLGFGVYQLRDSICTAACLEALAAGYRHIDGAELYRNSHIVRDAVRRSGLERKDVFLTTKVGSPMSRRRATTQNASIKEAVARIGGEEEGDYVDLLLIHVPGSSHQHRRNLWAALERIHSKGIAKSIGVSNFGVRHLKEMREFATMWPPSVNQIELHPWCQQRELVSYCRSHGIVVQAYSPLATGARLSDAVLGAVAAKHGKSPAQVLVRYSLQKGWVPLPRSAHTGRIRENADVFDFELDPEDMAKLDELDEGVQGARFPANVK